MIDSPPVLQIPDSRLMARFADGIIMVVRAGRTARDSAVLAHQRLAEDGSRVFGHNSEQLGSGTCIAMPTPIGIKSSSV